MACVSTIQTNIVRDCTKPLARGVDEDILIGMRDAGGWAATFDSTNPKIITALVAAITGAKLYDYQGKNYSNAPEVGFQQSDYNTYFPHSIALKLFSNSAATKQQIEALSTRKDLFVIYKRLSGDYEVMGLFTGMRMTAFQYAPNDESTTGAFQVTLTAAAEIGLPHTLIHTATVGGLPDTPTYLAGLTSTT